MREVNVTSRAAHLPDTFSDTELFESLTKMLDKGWVVTKGLGSYSLIGPGSTKTGKDLRELMNKVTKERMEAFL
ncbi:MAG: hypothetical protein HOG49_05515 [Candidatus Scalindua sp.]|jgi:hypothetical protein|nr:hypothetical protein [Candidatus Scalindua sp.]